MCIVNNILNAILYDMSTVNSYIVNNISLRRINNTDNEMNNHGDSRPLRRMKNSANQSKRCYDPAIREEEQGTAVCNYSELNGWLQRGPGNQCVFINGVTISTHGYL